MGKCNRGRRRIVRAWEELRVAPGNTRRTRHIIVIFKNAMREWRRVYRSRGHAPLNVLAALSD